MRILFAILMLFSVNASAGSIIKCQAADGSITFVDTRCPTGQNQVSKKSYQHKVVKPQSSIQNLQNGVEFPAQQAMPVTARQVFQAKFVQALSSVSGIKISMVEYYMYRGTWPEKIQDLGFNPEDMNSSLIHQTRVLDQGRINIQLAQDFGENKQIWLYPTLVMGGTQIEWSCFSNFPAQVLKSATGSDLCTSRYF
jgi:hypothetical protein